MTFPREYGGHARSALERYVVSEELLAAGAPVVKARDETRRVQEVTELLDRLAQAAAAEASPEELRRCA